MFLRLLCFLSVLWLCAGRLLAQTYEPGLLVRANGDTLRGEVENDFWVAPPTFIRFRATPASPTELLHPRQLRAVSFTGGRYFRYEALLLDHAAETRFNALSYGNYIDMKVDTLLAEVLLTGPIELRRVAWPGAVHYVLQRPGQPPLSLSERKYLREGEAGRWQVTDGNNYRAQLEMYFGDCPAAAALVKATPFTAEGLAAVAQAWVASCAPGAPPVRSWLALAKPRRRGAFQAGVLAGVRYHLLESPSYFLPSERTDGQLHPFGGLYAELLQPSRTTAIYGELTLSTFRNKGSLSIYDYNTGQYSYTAFDYQAVLGTARIGVRYLAPLAHNRQFVFGLGLERNIVWGLTTPAASNGAQPFPTRDERSAVTYADPVLLPNVTLGWRQQRFTATIDGQLYISRDTSGGGGVASGISSMYFGSNLAARLGLSYRLGHNPDAARPAR